MKRNIKNIIKLLLSVILLCFLNIPAHAEEKEDFSIKDLIFEHLGDSYKWHFITYNEEEVSLYLPVIVRSENGGWHIFSSSRLEKGASYEGFHIAHEGKYKHKIVETNSTGAEIRPIDLSITKNAVAMFVSIIIMLACILPLARWYKDGRIKPAGGFRGMIEVVILNIHDEVIKPCIGDGYQRFAPFLLTAFFFILTNNFMGLIPIFPFGDRKSTRLNSSH